MTPISSIDRSIAYWSFGWLPSEDLPSVAVEALEDGLESPSIIDLASADKGSGDRLHQLFEKAITEFGRTRLTKVSAGRMIAREYAERICEGKVAPIDGARVIWKISLECEELRGELGEFGGRVSEYEGWPEGHERIAEMIVAAARELVAQAK